MFEGVKELIRKWEDCPKDFPSHLGRVICARELKALLPVLEEEMHKLGRGQIELAHELCETQAALKKAKQEAEAASSQCHPAACRDEAIWRKTIAEEVAALIAGRDAELVQEAVSDIQKKLDEKEETLASVIRDHRHFIQKAKEEMRERAAVVIGSVYSGMDAYADGVLMAAQKRIRALPLDPPTSEKKFTGISDGYAVYDNVAGPIIPPAGEKSR